MVRIQNDYYVLRQHHEAEMVKYKKLRDKFIELRKGLMAVQCGFEEDEVLTPLEFSS